MYEVNAKIPALISPVEMSQWGISLLWHEGQGFTTVLDGDHVRIQRMQTGYGGHSVISLLDFNTPGEGQRQLRTWRLSESEEDEVSDMKSDDCSSNGETLEGGIEEGVGRRIGWRMDLPEVLIASEDGLVLLDPEQPVRYEEEYVSEESLASEEWSTTTPEVMETRLSDVSGESSSGEGHPHEREEDPSLDEVVHDMLDALQAERSRRRALTTEEENPVASTFINELTRVLQAWERLRQYRAVHGYEIERPDLQAEQDEESSDTVRTSFMVKRGKRGRG